MKKPAIIIGKRQIILSCLSVMLAVAVYINYSRSKPDLTVTTPTSELTAEQDHYGDTEFVNAGAEDVRSAERPEADDANADAASAEEASADFFAQARLEKTTNRDAAVQTLQMIMGGGDLTNDEIITTALNAVEVSNLIECEGNIESLIKSQGFADCVVYLDGETAKVVVKSEGLEAADAALIKDIILGEVSISSENIRIFEVK